MLKACCEPARKRCRACVSQVAGAYGMTLLYGVAPPLMALRLLNVSAAAPSETSHGAVLESEPEMIPGLSPGSEAASEPLSLLGMKPVLSALCASATGVALSQAWADSGHPSWDTLLRGLVTASSSVAGEFAGIQSSTGAAVTDIFGCV